MTNKIAIIGYACRLPGQVSNPDDLWELCTRGRSGWSEIPKDRFSSDAFHHPNPSKPGSFNPKGGYFLKDDITKFDAPFFNLSAKEAISMDPQQRILLECTFEAFENAGVSKEYLAGRHVGVYVGANLSDYEIMNMRDIETAPMHQATGCAIAMQSNRISYCYDLRGPSMTFDTACSGSLVALHHAVRSLNCGESTEAVVAGCHLNILPDYFVTMSMSQLFNDTGKTFAFDERAVSGFARGEGAGVVVLKPLQAALRDGDPVRAVICNSGVGQDGKTQGITNPNGAAQRDLISKVYHDAGLNLRECAFAEMHGTGTRIGDVIEATAVHEALSHLRSPQDPLYIGSVKSNVGHLEGASGVVSIIKAAMMLEKELVLPNTNFRKANPAIPLDDWNMKVLTSTKPWPRGKKYVSVSNYGFGGTNAHAVLEKPPLEARHQRRRQGGDTTQPDPNIKLFVISANDKDSLRARMNSLAIYFEQHPEVFEKQLCPNLAYTLGSHRSHLTYRVAISAGSLDELGTKIAQARISASRVLGKPAIGFAFTGQGAQWAQMGASLLNQYPFFASAVYQADKCLRKLGAAFSLTEEMQKEPSVSSINSPHISQPACTAVQIGLVDLFWSWGIQPSSVVGHSSGEIAAAYAAGAFSADTAMALAYHRGNMTLELKRKFPALKGGMIAVGVGPEAVRPYLKRIQAGYTTIACVNSPSSVTVSGDETAITELHETLEANGIFNRRLKIDVAYHSQHMELVSEQYLASIAAQTPGPSLTARFYSSVHGQEIRASDLAPSYWVQNLISTVRFSDALAKMCSSEGKPDLLIEIGPHSALKGPIKDTLKSLSPQSTNIAYSPSLLRKTDDAGSMFEVESLLATAGQAYARGAVLNMTGINFPRSQARFCSLLTDLPRYPWQHSTSYWHEARVPNQHKVRAGRRNDVLGVVANYSNDLEPTWRNILRLDDVPWLRHHKMQGMPVFPLAGYVSMVVEAAQQRANWRGTHFDTFELREIVVGSALVLDDSQDTETTITLRPHKDASRGHSDVWDEFKICSWDSKRGWAEHCHGLARVVDSRKHEDRSVTASAKLMQAQLRKTAAEVEANAIQAVDEDEMYRVLDNVGASYGPTFRGLRNCYTGTEHIRGHIYAQDTQALMPKGFESELVIHPALLDIFVHLTWPLLGAGRTELDTLYMPTMIHSVKISRNVIGAPGEGLAVWCKGSPDPTNSQPTAFELCATRLGEEGMPLIQFDGFVMTPIRDSSTAHKSQAKRLCFKMTPQPFAEAMQNGSANGIRTNGENGSAQVNGSKNMNGVNGSASHNQNGHGKPSEYANGAHRTNGTNGHSNDDEESNVVVVQLGDDQKLVTDLVRAIDVSTGASPTSCALKKIDCTQKRVIIIQSGSKSLRSITQQEFNSLKDILLTAMRVMWVYPKDQPEAFMSVGLARTVRSENMSSIAMLGVHSSELSSGQPSRSIMRALKALWFTEHDEPVRDMEFSAVDGQLFVQKVEEDDTMNNFVNNETSATVLEQQLYRQPGRRLKIEIGTYGALDTLHFLDEAPAALGDDEVEIEVKATGINFKDIVVCMGQVSQPYIGVECSGVVAAVGKNVHHIRKGQRVMAMTEGAYSTYARCLGTSAFPIPDAMTFAEAATVPVVFCTAYYGLFTLGRLAQGERVLIHAAAGGVGQAAIMLAQMTGADIYATVGSQDKKQFLIDKYSIPEDRIFYSRDTSFGSDIRRATNGDGIDVVLNSLAGDILRETWDCLAPFGRFIEIGKADITRNSRLDMMKFEYNCTFASVDLTKVASHKPKLMHSLLADVNDVLSKGLVAPISPIKVHPISEVELAFRALQGGRTMGKLVIEPRPEDQVLAAKAKVGADVLHANATYVLIGGTGGLGRSMAKWMSSKGSRHIVLVSRSASVNEKTRNLIDQLALSGTQVVVRSCDVSSKSSIERLVRVELKDLPPICGVIHGAMVLKDMLFEQMGLDDFQAVTACKVEGALNMHEVLSDSPLDFFIVLSSVAGVVGNRGQAAYAAANVFLDEFMRFRRSKGLPGISIDLAAVSNVGYLADGSEARRQEVLKNIGGQTVDEAEVLALLAAAITGEMDASCEGQCITGLGDAEAESFWLEDGKFAALREQAQAGTSGGALAGPAAALSKVIRTAASKESALQALTEALSIKIAAVLVMSPEDIGPTLTLKSLGLDSLVAIEIRNWIARETETNVQVLELLSSGSIASLAELILKKMGI